MAVRVTFTDDAREVLAAAGAHLASEPVRHNMVATLLHRCAALDERGRFWMAVEDGSVTGIAFQWPDSFFAAVTPMRTAATRAVADAVVAAGGTVPGVNGETATAAAFAGRWTEATGGDARAVEAQRLYAVQHVIPSRPTSGAPRPAEPSEVDLVASWLGAFSEEIGEPPPIDAVAIARRRVAAREIWFWDHGGATCLVGLNPVVNEAVRVGPVYTPPRTRGRGFASALVAHVSAAARADGLQCLLYADLANASSNRIYRALGYEAVAETLRYEFTPPPTE